MRSKKRTKNLLFLWLTFVSLFAFSQQPNCSITLRGTVHENDTHLPVADVTIVLKESQKTAMTDSLGRFAFSDLCKGKTTLVLLHLGSPTSEFSVTLKKDTLLPLFLNNNALDLNEVEITSEKKDAASSISTLVKNEIAGVELLQTRGLSLGESLKKVTGVTSVQMGPTISKPVIHGLYGNRILIMNNGIRQEGQQWGNDHAPEIDPFIASEVSVIKGAASIRYGSDAIGGVIMLDAPPLPNKEGVGAGITLMAGSNGFMGGTSAYVEQAFGGKAKGLAYRVQGTLKRSGNYRTANYYMQNTGMAEGDISAELGYKKNKWGVDIYFSSFNQNIGIFAGSQIGNLADLQTAIARGEPLGADTAKFSYKIGKTNAHIMHHLIKASAYYIFKDNGKLYADYNQQWDTRKEYDVDIPLTVPLSMQNYPTVGFNIITQNVNAVYSHKTWKGFSGSAGLRFATQGNVYAGLTSLIPNFRNYTGGIFWLEHYTKGKFTIEAGIRDDFLWERAYMIDQISLAKTTPTRRYDNVSFMVGATYHPFEQLSINLNFGSAYRPPNITELYIHGTHLSDATYNLGDSNLVSERSYNTTLSVQYHNRWVRVYAEGYFNYINNYIYSPPEVVNGQLHYIQLINGAFPVFAYTQTNAYFTGGDIDATFFLWKGFSLQSKLSLIRGYNVSAHDYLVLVPANRWENILKYTFAEIGKAKNLFFEFSDLWVMRQNHFPANSDFSNPPKGYNLLGLGVGCTFPMKQHKADLSLSIYNLSNAQYRDYLNLFRYYTNDLGISVMFRASFTLNWFKKD